MHIIQIKTIYTSSDTEFVTETQEYEFVKEFWQFIPLQQSFLPLAAKDGRCSPDVSWHEASVQTNGGSYFFTSC